jgi:DNA polymerase III alpha subunit
MDRIRHICERRIQERYSASDRSGAAQRLDRELRIIRETGQIGPFEEAIATAQFFRDRGESCRLIGSGCCSLVAYLMDLSDIDPLQHGLPYERFLGTGPGRTVDFTFVATPPTLTQRNRCRFQSEAVTVRAATTLETVPYLVARRVGRQLSGIAAHADPAAFALLRSGDIEGIDQLDGTHLKELLPALKPRSLIDIAAITALYYGELLQPGLIAKYVHRASDEDRSQSNWIVEEILRETRGLILFQEQIMLLLNRLAGIPLADGYTFIKDVCKRKREQIQKFVDRFMAEAGKAGLEDRDSQELIERIRAAATWATCKSHHLARAVTTYQAAYLKAHHPDEFRQTLKLIPD